MLASDLILQMNNISFNSILLINSFVLAVTNLIVTTFLIIRWEDPSKSIKAHVKIIFYGLLIYASLTYSNIILLNVVMLHNLPACLGPWAHMEVFSKGLEAEDAKVSILYLIYLKYKSLKADRKI